MNTTQRLRKTALIAGLLTITAPTLAGHKGPWPASSAMAGYGFGMPTYRPYAYRTPAMPPYGYPRPMYRPPYAMPYGRMMAPRSPYAAGYPAVGQPAVPAAAASSAASATALATDAVADEAAVTIRQMQFSPARVTIEKGATVTWTQRDSMPHTVIADDGSFQSQTLSGGGRYSQTFDEPGSYSYYCSLHPSMRGEIVVVD